MAEDDGFGFKFNGGSLAMGLLGLALLFAVLGIFLGWFTVKTSVEGWTVDPDEEDRKGESCRPVCYFSLDNEMKPLSLGTKFSPKPLEDAIKAERDPNYDDDFPRAGERMLGVFMFQTVVLLSLVAAIGFWMWHRRGRRDFSPTVKRATLLYAVFSLVGLSYMAFAVPAAAEDDARETLQEYYDLMRDAPDGENVPPLPPEMLQVNVSFIWTWVCCPCCPDQSIFQTPGGQSYLWEVRTESRPGAGFWLQSVGLLFTAAAFVLGSRVGDLAPKGPMLASQPPPPPPLLASERP